MASNQQQAPTSEGIAGSLPESVRRIVDAAFDKKATGVVVLDMQGSTDVTDYFIICTGAADPHVQAIVEAIEGALDPFGRQPWHVEGKEQRNWVLVDFVDVVAHVFRADARRYYALEDIWADAARIDFPDQDD